MKKGGGEEESIEGRKSKGRKVRMGGGKRKEKITQLNPGFLI